VKRFSQPLAAQHTLASNLARFVLRCGRVLPATTAFWLGGTLGWFIGGLPGRDQRRAREHLAIAWPDRDPRWIERVARKCFRHYGRMVLWTLARMHLSPEQQRRGVIVEGADNLRIAAYEHRHRRGAVGASGHFGNWELLVRIGGSLVSLALVAKRLRDPGLDCLVAELRRGNDSSVIYQDDGAMPPLRALREGRLISTLADQDVPRLASVHVPWFGRLASTPVGPAQLAVLSKSPLQPVYCYWKGGRWVVHWGPRYHGPQSGDRETDAKALTAWATAYLESLVRRHPEQWVWWHKRWRTPPPAV
jgi:Kdo2-lipid IVA lauroyltransferase/acyltransferase